MLHPTLSLLTLLPLTFHLLPLIFALCPLPVEGALLPVKAAFHVHTTFSTGALSLEAVIEEARREGIGSVILTDNLLLRFEYGLFPLRGLVKKVVEKPSIRQMGIERYLQAIEAAQARFPEVILIPGVEVVPYYYWTGSPFFSLSPWGRRMGEGEGSLTLWDAQKNLLIVGLSRPEDYRRIPAIGNFGFRISDFGLNSAISNRQSAIVTLVLAMVAMGGGLLLLRLQKEQKVRLQYFTLKVQKRYRLPGWIALGIGVLLVAEAFTTSELNPYRGNLGIEPYQRVIDFVRARGGMVFWSFPEARDLRREAFGPLGTVTIRTEPYPEALLHSQGYTGFGAVYQDNVTVTEPGGVWDQLLLAYAEGRRERPVWGIGELGYHGPPKRLGDILTVFFVTERSRAAILSALKAGRFYSVQPLPEDHLVLEDFSISQEARRAEARMGEELEVDGERPLQIHLRLSASDGWEVPFTLRLIRSGRLLSVLQAETPFEVTLASPPPEKGGRVFFRIDVTSPHRLLSNPIFVRRGG